MSRRFPTETVLAFGDVVQFGDHAPHQYKPIYWGGIDVVQGLNPMQALGMVPEGDLPHGVRVFPARNDGEGDPFLELPEMRWGTHVRIFGSLPLLEVRRLLTSHVPDDKRASIILAHADNMSEIGGGGQKYRFTPHNETGFRSASYRWSHRTLRALGGQAS